MYSLSLFLKGGGYSLLAKCGWLSYHFSFPVSSLMEQVQILGCAPSPPLVGWAEQGDFFTRDTGVTPFPGSTCLCVLRLWRLRWLSSQSPVDIPLGQACPMWEAPFPWWGKGALVTCDCRWSWSPEDTGPRLVRVRSQSGSRRRVACCCLRAWACLQDSQN